MELRGEKLERFMDTESIKSKRHFSVSIKNNEIKEIKE